MTNLSQPPENPKPWKLVSPRGTGSLTLDHAELYLCIVLPLGMICSKLAVLCSTQSFETGMPGLGRETSVITNLSQLTHQCTPDPGHH